MAFDLRHLRHIALLAETGNFSRAAELAGITQPAFSRSVSGLEADVGFAIFDRTPSGVLPTVAGAQFVKDAVKLLTQARQLETDTRALAVGEGGVFSFGLGPLLSSLILPELLADLAARFPRLRVVTMTGSADDLLAALADRKIELCLFAEGSRGLAGMSSRYVGSIPIGLLARAGHPLAGRQGLCFDDIKSFPLATGSFSGRAVGISVQLEPTIVCENFHVLREMVQRSDAIWLSSRALRSSPNHEDLIELDVQDMPVTQFAILLARMEQRSPSPASVAGEAAIETILGRIS